MIKKRVIFEEKMCSRLDVVPVFSNRVIERLKKIVSQKDEVFKIKLSLEESLSNAVRHGNKMKTDSVVTVTVELFSGELIISVHDQGQGFDFWNLPDPTHFENLEKPHGRGVFLIRQMMDKVEFFDGGRGIRMIKRVTNQGRSVQRRGNA